MMKKYARNKALVIVLVIVLPQPNGFRPQTACLVCLF